jgi:eukaryotic-like serine/threonine-protein kinase
VLNPRGYHFRREQQRARGANRSPPRFGTPATTALATISGIEGLLAGRTLVNRYLVEEVIGRGGMGAVYRARDRQLGREVAVKVITVAAPDRLAHERLRSRFQREARAAAALHHPCVVAVYDCGTDPDLSLDFFVMELLRGEDLASRLERRGRRSPGVTGLSILEQAARGLAAGHRAGLIHRDVKPGNIFVESGDRAGEVRVKILDFGIAELTSAEGDTVTQLTVAGVPPFRPHSPLRSSCAASRG